MIDDFIDSAIIIDDKKEEIEGLINLLEEKGIWTKYFFPEDLENREVPLKNRKIIFLDLYVDDKETEATGQIAIIRKIFKKTLGMNFGTYGIVVWSAHTKDMLELKSKMQNDSDKYTLPLFIVGLDKYKYLKEDDFSDLFHDLNQELEKNIAAEFFIKWNNLVSQGKDKAITNIYSLIKDYEKQDKNLQFILFQMARNYTGMPFEDIGKYPLHIDAFKAFNDMMNYEITTNQGTDCDIFTNIDDVSFVGIDTNTEKYEYGAKNHICVSVKDRVIKKDDNVLSSNDQKNANNASNIKELVSQIIRIYSYVNSKILIDENNIQQSEIIPGNIYEIMDGTGGFKKNNSPNNSTSILIEMTPPCDYSNNNMINPRVLEGFVCDYSEKLHGDHKKEYFYNQIWPLKIKNKEKPQMIVFDFRCFGFIKEEKLKDASQYKVLFRAKNSLFADILQKLSSHTARLGLSIIN